MALFYKVEDLSFLPKMQKCLEKTPMTKFTTSSGTRVASYPARFSARGGWKGRVEDQL